MTPIHIFAASALAAGLALPAAAACPPECDGHRHDASRRVIIEAEPEIIIEMGPGKLPAAERTAAPRAAGLKSDGDMRFWPGTDEARGGPPPAPRHAPGMFAFQPEGFSQPLERRDRERDRPHSSSTTTLITTDGDQTYKVTIRDGEVSAEVNGEPLGEDQIELDGNRVILYDEDGEKITELRVAGVPGGSRFRGQEFGDPSEFLRRFQQRAAQSAPPPVMIGVTMSAAPESVLSHLGVEPPVGVLIDRVIEGLPAAKAGLEPGDIVVAVDGKAEIDEQKLRAILRSKEPGDVIEVKIIRKGAFKTFKVELAKWEGSRLRLQRHEDEQRQMHPFGPDGAPFDWQQLVSPETRRSVEEALKQLKKDLVEIRKDIDVEQYRELAEKALTDALEALEGAEALERFAPQLRRWMPDGDEVEGWMELRGDRGERFAVPRAPAPPPAPEAHDVEDRLDRIEDRLDRIEALLKKLAEDDSTR